MSTAISSNKFDILRSDDENERNYDEHAVGGGVAKYVNNLGIYTTVFSVRYHRLAEWFPVVIILSNIVTRFGYRNEKVY